MNILFWLYKSRMNKKGLSPLMMRITIEGKRAEIATNIELAEKTWDHQKQRMKGRNAQSLQYNKIIQTYRSLAWNYYGDALKKQHPVTANAIRGLIQHGDIPQQTLLKAFDYQINSLKARVGNDIACSTVKKYETCKRKVIEFLKIKLHREDILLYELSGRFIFQLDAYLRTGQGLGHNAVVKNMQQFKRVIKVAVQNEWLDRDPFTGYSTAPKETDRGFLSREELDTLEKIPLESKRLERVRDLFIFSCYTGLAYADVSKLSSSHIVKGENNSEWIVLSRTKSKSRATIPILPKAKAILDKYANPDILKGQHLLPVISNQNINKYLKEIAAIAGINKRVSFHLARHTFATTVTLNKGVDIVSVSKMLGHKNLRTTQIYAKVSMRKIAEDMKGLMDSGED